MEYIVAGLGLIVSFFIVRSTKTGKNYGDLTKLIIQYKRKQQGISKRAG